jgi:putative ABC transport system permease protein
MSVLTNRESRTLIAGPWLLLKLGLRELRGGIRGFYVFIACVAIGVMAIAGVGSIAQGLADGLGREGRVIIGGDVAFSLIHREAAPDELAYLQSRGDVSTVATLPWRAPPTDVRRWSNSRRLTPPIRSMAPS